uniref:Uncharacterized protein n=1 Tax=Aegilops tauschii subsp. strangulata TaxID=200361 RepID=A0A453MZ01_AEGTS
MEQHPSPTVPSQRSRSPAIAAAVLPAQPFLRHHGASTHATPRQLPPANYHPSEVQPRRHCSHHVKKPPPAPSHPPPRSFPARPTHSPGRFPAPVPTPNPAINNNKVHHGAAYNTLLPPSIA